LSFILYKNNDDDDGTNCWSSKPSVNIIQLDFNSSALKRNACGIQPATYVLLFS
jgi:hypothetical protein